MASLPTFQLPLPARGPPSGYALSDRPPSETSMTSAFHDGLNDRDVFLGVPRCVVCGADRPRDCQVIVENPKCVSGEWSGLRDRSWIPLQAKEHAHHDPRNGLLMCPNHRTYFHNYEYFIRFCPDVQKFILVNYSDKPILRPFHGKAIAVDVKDRHAPFPSIFVIHEMRVRGHNPFRPLVPSIPDDIPWQDWVSAGGVFDSVSGSFKREGPRRCRDGDGDDSASAGAQLQFPPATTSAADAPPSGKRTLALNADVVADILAATRAMPSWRACQMEGTSWTGTGEENVQKYVSSIGIQEDP